MGFLIITKLMLAMVIFLHTNSNVSGNERNVCEYCTHAPGFPSKKDSLKTGVYIGICRDDYAPHNENCAKVSDQCVSLKLKKTCSKLPEESTLAKFFPKEAEGKELKGCWKDGKTGEVKQMIESCGGSFEYIKQCEINAKGVCNKDEPMAVVHTGVKVGIPVALILVGLIALFVCWKKNLLCFKKSRSENLQ